MDATLKQKVIAPVIYDHIATFDNGEAPVAADGFRQDPFWLDYSALVRDIEGKFYLPYIAEHSDFQLLVREGVYQRLVEAQKCLPESWHIVVRAAFRPLDVQRAMFDDFLQKVRIEHQDWTQEKCSNYAGQYVANANRAIAPHTTGGAVDIDVYDGLAERLVDFGCAICDVGEISHCLRDGLTLDQRQNQEALLTAMMAAGFAPLHSEWWHFSYGDQRWAAFYGKNHAIYGAIG